MTKKELVKIIREVVRREIKTQLNEAIKNSKVLTAPSNKKLSIKDALLETKDTDFPTMKTFNAVDARAGFAAMQNSMTPQQQQLDLRGNPVNVENLGGGIDKALTRDYSSLVKRFNKKW